jgi:hypothetical protein
MLSSRTIFFFGLNAVRIVGIISLILVFASGILVMVRDVIAVNDFLNDAKSSGTPVDQLLEGCDYIENSTVPNQTGGVFWAVVNQLLIITQVIILILSECGWPMSAFDRFFPVLGASFGLGPLGVFECLIGATILSHFVDDFTLVAAFFLFSLGCLNILLGLIFGVKARQKRSIRAWRSDPNDVLPPVGEKRPQFVRPDVTFMDSIFQPKKDQYNAPPLATSGHGFGLAAERSTVKGIMISKPLESLPNYSPPHNQPKKTRSRPGSGSSIYSTDSERNPIDEKYKKFKFNGSPL